jgi:cytochrome bd-type quinol oxidase subunit 2
MDFAASTLPFGAKPLAPCGNFRTSVMFWPYTIPYTVTIADAAAPDASLGFLFYGGVVVVPVIAIYTISVHWAFRGKTHRGYG